MIFDQLSYSGELIGANKISQLLRGMLVVRRLESSLSRLVGSGGDRPKISINFFFYIKSVNLPFCPCE